MTALRSFDAAILSASMSAPTAEKTSSARTRSRKVLITVLFAGAGALFLLALSLSALRRGTAARSDGEPAIARVERATDGSCLVGGRNEHCYRLEFSVYPKGSATFRASLDVNVQDRWASRIQPGSYVWVVRSRENAADVALAVEAFAEPAPKLELDVITR